MINKKDALLRIEDIQNNRLRQWSDQSGLFESWGVYDSIAEKMDLQSGEVVADLGSGLGQLAIAIRQKYADVFVCCVECSSVLLDASEKRIAAAGLPYVRLDARQIEWANEDDTRLHKKFDPSQLNYLASDWLQDKKAPIVLIDDDLRTHEAFSSFIGNQRLNVVSVLFHGSALEHVFFQEGYESAHEISLNNNRAIEFLDQDAIKIKEQVFRLAFELLADQGRFVLAQKTFQLSVDNSSQTEESKVFRENGFGYECLLEKPAIDSDMESIRYLFEGHSLEHSKLFIDLITARISG